MAVTVTVQVAAQALDEICSGRSDLLALARQLGVQLTPLDPATPALELRRFFLVEVTDPAQVESVLARLREHPRVEAAYIKPHDEPPSASRRSRP